MRCQVCGSEFERTAERGPVPRYCSAACRQRAYRERHAGMTDFPEQHCAGRLSIENDEIVRSMDLTNCDVGVQVSHDGRIWLCVNGTAWIRFKPDRSIQQRVY